MRADTDAGQAFLMHVPEVVDEFRNALGLPVAVMPPHDLPVGDAMHALRGEGAHGLGVGHDVGRRRGAGLNHHACAPIGGFLPWASFLQFGIHRVETDLPSAEAVIGATAHFRHVGVLQVGMRVDQAGGDDAVPVVFDDTSVGGHVVFQLVEHPSAGAHMHHAASGHGHGTIQHHRSGDGNDHR